MARPLAIEKLRRSDLEADRTMFGSFRGILIIPHGIPITVCQESLIYDMRGKRLSYPEDHYLRMVIVKSMIKGYDYVLIEWLHYGYRIVL